MRFNDVCKGIAALILGLSILGGFFVAEEQSKKIEYDTNFMGEIVTEEIQDNVTYAIVLISTWVAGGILTLFIYGMGKIYELQENINYHLQEIDDKLNKTS
jgi:hypothetical protein